MKSNSIRYLAEDLYDHGVPSLRYDKRGVAKSAKSGPAEKDVRLSTFVDDAGRWIDVLSRDYKSVIVVGHSEGAKIGTLASIGNPKVSGLVLLAGTGRPTDEILKMQVRQNSPMILESVSAIVDTLKLGKTVENVPQMLNALFRPSVQRFLISDFAVDPAAELQKIECPVLIIQGDKDIQVGVGEANLLHDARPASKLVVIQDMNHVLKECTSTDMAVQMETYVKPDIGIKSQVAREIADFLDKL